MTDQAWVAPVAAEQQARLERDGWTHAGRGIWVKTVATDEVVASIAEPDPYSAEGSIEWLRNETKDIPFCASHLERIRKELARRADAVEAYQGH